MQRRGVEVQLREAERQVRRCRRDGKAAREGDKSGIAFVQCQLFADRGDISDADAAAAVLVGIPCAVYPGDAAWNTNQYGGSGIGVLVGIPCAVYPGDAAWNT